jgi:GNAT superfamily N-acetyltransferase
MQSNVARGAGAFRAEPEYSWRQLKMGYYIVPAILKDASGIAVVFRDAFPGDASHYRVRSWEREARKIMRCHMGWITFVAIEDGEVVGLIAARHLKTRSVPTIRIEWLGVHSSQRGKGLGKALMDQLMDWIYASFPESRVRLTLRARTGVQDFYRKLGFRHYGSGWMKMVAKK